MGTLKKNIIYQYGLQIAKYLFPFITLPYLTRVLGPDTYAIRAYVLSVMTFFQVLLDYGFNSYGIREIARHRDSMQHVQSCASVIAILRLALSGIGLVPLALLIMFIPLLTANPVYVLIAYLGICFKAMLPDFIFTGFEDMGIITKRFVVSQAISLVLIFAVVRGPEDILWVPVFEGIASFVAFAWSWENVLFKRKIRFARVKFNQLKSAFAESSIFFVSNASTVILTGLTTLLIGIFIDTPADISYWSLTMTAISAVQSLYNPISNSLYPRMCVSKDTKLLKKFLVVGTVAATIGAVLFALLSSVIMLVLGGEEYMEGAYLLVLAAPMLVFSYPAILLGYPTLGAFGEAKRLSASSVISAAFHIIGLVALLLIDHFSIAGVAILRSITELVLLIARVAFAYIVLKNSKEDQSGN